MSQHLDRIFYINLDKREDRKREIETELVQYGLLENTERIPAVLTPEQGILGCTMSHLHALKVAKERGYRNVLILEDDFQFTITKDAFENRLTEFFDANVEYDVCMISFNMKQSQPTDYLFLQKVIESQTASGYIVHCGFYDRLIELYEWAVPRLEETRQHWNYANDQCWKKLQPDSNWYAFTERCGIQRAGYSDNSGQFENHGC